MKPEVTVVGLSISGSGGGATALQPSTNEQVGHRFFKMIGIESRFPATVPKSDGSKQCGDSAHIPPSSQDWVNPRTEQVSCFTEELKYDPTADSRTPPKRRKIADQESPAPSKRKRRLHFNESVNVVPIPMRSEYSNSVRTRLWSNAVEISQNAARNAFEFASEG